MYVTFTDDDGAFLDRAYISGEETEKLNRKLGLPSNTPLNQTIREVIEGYVDLAEEGGDYE